MHSWMLIFVLHAIDSSRISEAHEARYTTHFYPVIKNALRESSICRNLPICRYFEPPDSGKKEETSLQARSYYGYGGSPLAPALYPAIDTVSVLASLAFLAFLLHSFASLFDRSRSIIPSVVSNRQNSGEFDTRDPVKLVLRALDEYDVLSTNALLENTKSSS